MGRGRVSRPESRPDRSGQRAVPPVATGRRALGLEVVERHGRWHVYGTVVVRKRHRRVRSSTGLAATAETYDAANEERRRIEAEIRDELVYGLHPSVPLTKAIAEFKAGYVTRRKRPMDGGTVAFFDELARVFGDTRMLNTITEAEWAKWIDKRQSGNASTTRERYISMVLAFLRWCKKPPRHWLAQLPAFERDENALNPRRPRRARQVGAFRPDLIARLAEHAAPHYKGQLAALFSGGPRTSSLIYGCKLRDYLAAPGREQITFHDTKNGDDVTVLMHPWSVKLMDEYLKWRGRLHDRDGPLFLTDSREPYTPTRSHGGQTKRAFQGMVTRAGRELRTQTLMRVAALRQQCRKAEARAHWLAMRADLELLAQLTPHWFRHRIATFFLASGDLRSGMEQGGWRDVQSIMGYSHDVTDHRRGLVFAMDTPALPIDDVGKSVTRAESFVKNAV